MTVETVMLIKMLTDLIITLTNTLAKVGEMSDEDVKKNMLLAEKLSNDLLEQVT